MIQLLMLEPDALLARVIAGTLEREGVRVAHAVSVRAARAALASPDVDAGLFDRELLRDEPLGEVTRVPIVLTTTFMVGPPLPGLETAPVLVKPFTASQLFGALRSLLGPWRDDPTRLVDALVRAHRAGCDVAFRVGRGEIFLEAGELVHAHSDALVGESALAVLLADGVHAPLSIPCRPVTRTIERPFRSALLDALGTLEAWEEDERDGGTTPPTRRGERP